MRAQRSALPEISVQEKGHQSERSHIVRTLGRRWFVRQIVAPGGYAAAAAVEEPHRRLRWRQWKVQG